MLGVGETSSLQDMIEVATFGGLLLFEGFLNNNKILLLHSKGITHGRLFLILECFVTCKAVRAQNHGSLPVQCF